MFEGSGCRHDLSSGLELTGVQESIDTISVLINCAFMHCPDPLFQKV